MEVIICGAGALGYNIARYLVKENNNVTIIDKDPSLVAKINENLDCRGVVGYASAPSTWEKIGVDRADMVIAVTRNDEINIMACKVAHYLFRVSTKIARIREQSYLKQKSEVLFKDSGTSIIDLIVSPEKELAKAILRRVHAPGATDIVPLNTPNVSLVGGIVAENSPILKDSVERIFASHMALSSNIMAIMHKDSVQAPDPKGVLSAGEEVYFVCPSDKVLDTLALFGHEQHDAHNVLIIGGGNVGADVADALSDDCKVTLIENNVVAARKLAERLPHSVVIQGDALKPEVLIDAAVHQKHLCVCVSDNDEVNLISSMYAVESGVDRTICLLNNPHYSNLARKFGVSTTVYPMEIIGSIILQKVRNSSAVKSLYSLQENRAEIVEMEVSHNAKVVGMKLGDLKMFRGTYIGMIMREGDEKKVELIPYKKELQLCAGDKVVMLVSPSNIERIVQMFKDNT